MRYVERLLSDPDAMQARMEAREARLRKLECVCRRRAKERIRWINASKERERNAQRLTVRVHRARA